MPTHRDEMPFTFHASCGMPLYGTLAGVRFDRLFVDFDAIVRAYEEGRPRAEALYGPRVNYGGPEWAGISYGHVNCLGSELIFPEDSEVGHTPIYRSLNEAIRALQEPVNWASAGMMPFYLDLWRKLRQRYSPMPLPFPGFGVEGPITTAWELRGHDFFMDVHDDPAGTRRFLELVTDSIVSYIQFIRQVNGQPPCSAEGRGMADDIASLLHPAMWPQFVLPFYERYYTALTTGQRWAHIENLMPDHLPHLDAIGLDRFDPSVSPKLRATDLRDRCRVPFLWRVNEMDLRDRDDDDLRRYVVEGVADGASGTFCNIPRRAVRSEQVSKVHLFLDTATQIEALLSAGCPRDLLRHELAGLGA